MHERLRCIAEFSGVRLWQGGGKQIWKIREHWRDAIVKSNRNKINNTGFVWDLNSPNLSRGNPETHHPPEDGCLVGLNWSSPSALPAKGETKSSLVEGHYPETQIISSFSYPISEVQQKNNKANKKTWLYWKQRGKNKNSRTDPPKSRYWNYQTWTLL